MSADRASRRVSDFLMPPGFPEWTRKLHEPGGARLVAAVAHALLRAVSRLISTPALLFDTPCESCARTGRREESRRGTQECVRYVGDHLPHSGSSSFLDIRRSEALGESSPSNPDLRSDLKVVAG